MKILLDECLPKRLKLYLKGYDVKTVTEMKWQSLKNGELIKEAIKNEFDIILTVDKKLEFQQNISSLNITIVVFNVVRNKIEEIKPLIPKFIKMINSIEKGKFYSVR